MFKSWSAENSPGLPLFHIERNNDNSCKLWLHSTAIAENLDLSSKKVLEIFIENYESFPLLHEWQTFLGEEILNSSKFNIREAKNSLSLCMEISSKKMVIV